MRGKNIEGREYENDSLECSRPSKFSPRAVALVLFLELLSGVAAAQDATATATSLPSHLMDVACEYLRAGELADAMKLLGEAADIDALPLNKGSAATAALHRRLAMLDAEERFELLLAWSMPTESRRTVRVLTSLTPTVAPPSVFARALGERPSRDSFSVAAIGDVRGLFSTAWELVKAADESGNLRRFSADVSNLVEQDVPNARLLDRLARIIGTRREDENLHEEISQRAASLSASSDAFSATDLAIAAACLTRDSLQPLGEDIFQAGIRQPGDPKKHSWQHFLCYAHATAVCTRDESLSDDLISNSKLEWWTPASRAVWLSDQEHLLHVSGLRHDYLFFRYPLTGEFQFKCEAQTGGREDAAVGVGYGGLGSEASRASHLNTFSLVSTDRGVTLAINRQPAWTDTSMNVASPWIELRASGDRVSLFRNLEITGDPVIPREVRMSGADSLRGWVQGRIGQVHEEARISKAGNDLPTLEDAWFSQDGIIHCRRASQAIGLQQRLLHYLRPLQAGESISYEFVYEPGKREVHPTLGRLAFLIEPTGVRLRWMTEDDREWTGLGEDNAVVVPFDRRGPKPLPIVANDWNRMTIAIERDTVKLTLNDQLIYQRKVNAQADRTFGFYHDAGRTAVKVRNVVMRGDWPARLPGPQIESLAAADESKRSEADRDALSDLFPEDYLAGNVLQVIRQAAELPDEKRFAYLADWVLPDRRRSSLRMAGKFTLLPMPSPNEDPIGVVSRIEFAPARTNRLQLGSQLVAPALDLVKVAKELGRLDDVRKRLTRAEDGGSDELASQRWSMMALIDIASSDFAAANQHLDALVKAAEGGDEGKAIDRWPEMLAIWSALRHQATQETARELIEVLNERVRAGKVGETDAWKHQLATLSAIGRFQDELQAFGLTVEDEPWQQWDAVSHVSVRSRNQGFPSSQWLRLPHRADNVVAHDRDYLYFQSPLRGTFQVECDVAATFHRRESHLAYGGRWIRPAGTLAHYSMGDLRSGSAAGAATPISGKLTHPGEWMRYRLAIRRGRMRIYFNGRLMCEQALNDDSDPWLAIRTHWERNGAVRDVRISGNPIIPEQVELAVDEPLLGWLPYYGEAVGTPDAAWRFRNGELTGQSLIATRSVSEGQKNARFLANASAYQGGSERLLHYHRPMLEDGTIEYEFYYRPGQTHVHPALDRLAFLFEPEGVRVHWATSGEGEEDRADDVTQSRRGPAMLPLRQSDWNKVRLTLVGDSVAISLNGQLVYERQLEATNLRNFGLFHDARQTKARVRKIIWRGEWPRELPPLVEQELADVSDVAALEASLADLPKVVEVDFRRQELPRSQFGLRGSTGSNLAQDVKALPEGLRITRDGPNRAGSLDYSLGTLFGIGGDFDITVSYRGFEPKVVDEPGTGAVVWFFATVQNDREDHVVLKRSATHKGDGYIEAAHSWGPHGERRLEGENVIYDGAAGVARICRRGSTIYCLAAEDAAAPFRILDQYDVPPADLGIDGFRVSVDSWGKAVTSIVLKKITVRAERVFQIGGKLAGTLTPDDDSRQARYVRIDLPNKTEPLSLAEVEVFSDGKNVALGKPTRQSSLGWGGVAERAVDGNTNGHYYAAQSTTHTAVEREPWWEVDLGESHDIERISVWNRSDYGWTRLDGFRLQLLDEDRELVWEQTPVRRAVEKAQSASE
jgi:hypothetical protein